MRPAPTIIGGARHCIGEIVGDEDHCSFVDLFERAILLSHST
jgi:hypothetical protein